MENRMGNQKEKLRRLTLCAIFIAIILVMTVVPYTGYISVGVIAITTLHIPVIIGSIFLGWKAGMLIGGVWGLTCMIKAFAEPLPGNIPFQNPIVSVLPRICVGLVAGLLYALFANKLKLNHHLSALLSTIAATLTNTVLVLTALGLFNAYEGLIDTAANIIKMILSTIVAVNGVIELGAAILLVPLIVAVLNQVAAKKQQG